MLTFGANIVARYVFSRPIIWADELVVVLLLWVTFLTTAFMTQEREQVIFDLSTSASAPRCRRYPDHWLRLLGRDPRERFRQSSPTRCFSARTHQRSRMEAGPCLFVFRDLHRGSRAPASRSDCRAPWIRVAKQH